MARAIERIEREEEPWRTRFFDALPAATRTTIEDAPRLGWVPVDLPVELAEHVLTGVRTKHSHDYYRRAFADALRGPIFDALVRTGVRPLGVTPSALLRWRTRGGKRAFATAGRARAARSRAAAALCSGLHPSDGWLDSAQGSA